MTLKMCKEETTMKQEDEKSKGWVKIGELFCLPYNFRSTERSFIVDSDDKNLLKITENSSL